MNFEETYHLHPAMRMLWRAIGRERHICLAFAAALLLGGTAFGWVFFQKKNVLAAFGLAGMLLGTKLLWDVLRSPKVNDDRLWRLLNHHRKQIVWVYSIRTQTMPFGYQLWERGTMYFMLIDGDEIALDLPARKLKMVSRFMNKLLPHASFGYSEERRALFETNPASLLRNT
jgi:hypothetical protein